MKVEDTLESDKRILDATRKEVQNGQHVLVFDFGDLGTLTGAVPDKLDATIMTEWCMAVRREWNARNNVKAAASTSKAADVRSARAEVSASADKPSGGGIPVTTDVQGAKAAMEAGIESALVELDRQRAALEADAKSLEAQAHALALKLHSVDDLTLYYQQLRSKL